MHLALESLMPLPPPLLLGTIRGATPAFVKHLGAIGWPPLLIATCAGAGSALQGAVTAPAFMIHFRSLGAHGGVVTSQTGYVVTLTGLAWGWALFGERPGWLTIPAAALVFAGPALVTLPGRKP